MSLNELIALVVPPEKPVEVPSVREWIEIEALLGLRLPDDYRDLVAAYGTGRFDEFLWVFSPSTHNENLNLAAQLAAERERFAYSASGGGVTLPYELVPNIPGLLPCGCTDNGDMIYWIVNGSDTSSWTIAVAAARGEDFDIFEMSLSSFLAGILNHRITSAAFPGDFPSTHPSFDVSG